MALLVEPAREFVKLHVERVVLGDPVGESGWYITRFGGVGPQRLSEVEPVASRELATELLEVLLDPEELERGEGLLRGSSRSDVYGTVERTPSPTSISSGVSERVRTMWFSIIFSNRNGSS